MTGTGRMGAGAGAATKDVRITVIVNMGVQANIKMHKPLHQHFKVAGTTEASLKSGRAALVAFLESLTPVELDNYITQARDIRGKLPESVASIQFP